MRSSPLDDPLSYRPRSGISHLSPQPIGTAPMPFAPSLTPRHPASRDSRVGVASQAQTGRLAVASPRKPHQKTSASSDAHTVPRSASARANTASNISAVSRPVFWL